MFIDKLNDLNCMLGKPNTGVIVREIVPDFDTRNRPVAAVKPAHTAISMKPRQVIFNPPTTVVYWEDNTKTVVRCHKDDFSEEFGFAMACMRKIYGTRANFKSQFKNAYYPNSSGSKNKHKKSEDLNASEPVVLFKETSLASLLKELSKDGSYQEHELH